MTMTTASTAPEVTRNTPDVDPEEVVVVPFEGEGASWDAFVERAEGSTFCHLHGWRRIMEDVLGHATRYLVATTPEGAWRGVLPLVHVQSAIFGDYLVSMPFLNYGGPLGSIPARWALLESARAEAGARGVQLLELRTRMAMPSRLQVTDRRLTVVLDLPEDPETLWMGHLRGKVRNMVRRPQKEGMTARFGRDQVEDFYEVFALNMRDLGTPVLPREFFDAASGAFGDRMWIGIVRDEGRPVAAGCGFLWNGEFEMTWAASLEEYRQYTVNEFLYWSFMERAIRSGAKAFNFGRCAPGSGTHRWKRKWRGRDVPLPWLQWVPAGTPDQERPLFRAGSWLWSQLPVAMTNRVGPFLAGSLP